MIEEHGGVVEKFIGDAVMAVFGLYRSREDDAVRAVRAATAMIASTREVAVDVERRFGERLRMRVGLDTGDVVVSTLGERPGASSSPSARPSTGQPAAGRGPGGMVLISEDTRRQVRGRFGLHAATRPAAEGDRRPGRRLRRPRRAAPQLRAERAAGVGGVATRTVGRDLELRPLQEPSPTS